MPDGVGAVAPADQASAPPVGGGSSREVLTACLRLGLTSFGGPVSHLGYFRAEFVGKRRWLDEATYADLVALSQFLPGPSSSQVGIALGMGRAGLAGGLAAWCGFTLPSAVALVLFAYGVGRLGDVAHASWLHGLKIVAVAVVAQAVWGMAKTLCPDRRRATLAIAAAVVVLLVPSTLGQVGVIAFGVTGDDDRAGACHAGFSLPCSGAPSLTRGTIHVASEGTRCDVIAGTALALLGGSAEAAEGPVPKGQARTRPMAAPPTILTARGTVREDCRGRAAAPRAIRRCPTYWCRTAATWRVPIRPAATSCRWSRAKRSS